jgi:ketosteroid isomerase-like protein
MHTNVALLHRLFTALDHHDHPTMASCYHSAATFRGIAFDLRNRKQIHSMWHMICDGDIRATFEVVHANDQDGRVKVVDTYTFGATKDPPNPGRPVRNVVDSRFLFQDGLIVEHRDFCDAHEWARLALGGPIGFLAGRIRFLRSWKAGQMLKAFVGRHPEYR